VSPFPTKAAECPSVSEDIQAAFVLLEVCKPFSQSDSFVLNGLPRRAISPGFPKGAQSPLAHTLRKQSLVCYACPPTDGKICTAAIVGGADFSGRKTGWDF